MKNIGSSWLKWDLHVHSPASHNYTGTWEQFFEQVQNANCDVIGINDYYSVDGYKKVIEQKESGQIDFGSKVFFPVVEMRMTNTLKGRHDSGNNTTHYNFHVIFNPTMDVSTIEDFIKSLPRNSISDKTPIGSNYLEKDKLASVKTDFFEVIETLNSSSSLANNFLIWLPYNEHGGIDEIDPINDNYIKNSYIERADILGSSNEQIIKFFRWENPKYTQNEYIDMLKVKKACIKGSDSHKHAYPIGKLCNGDSEPIEKYCWIKAEPTFEGLTQIVYEPASRVYIGEEKPVQPVNTIDSLKFSIPTDARVASGNFCFAGNNNEYSLSPYLNCFIGGRGSGKSTILNFLGLQSNNPKTSKEFWGKDQKNNKSICPENFDPDSSDTFNFSGADKFDFLAQSEVEQFALKPKKFTEAIYDRANLMSENTLDQCEQRVKNFLSNIDGIITKILNYQELRKKKIGLLQNKKRLEQALKILSAQTYKKNLEIIEANTKKIGNIKYSKMKLDMLRGQLDVLIADEINCEGLENPYTETYQAAILKVKEVIEYLSDKDFSQVEKQIKSLQEDVDKSQVEINDILERSGYSPENIQQIKLAPKNLHALNSEILQVDQELEKTADAIKALNPMNDLISSNNEFKEKMNELIQPLNNILNEQLDKDRGNNIKKIELRYRFNSELAWHDFSVEIVSFFAKRYEISKSRSAIDFLLEKKNEFLSDGWVKVKEFLDVQDKTKQYILFLIEVFSEELNFKIFCFYRDRYLYDINKYKMIDVLYDERLISNLSFGQRCTAVIVIMLLFGNNPLIIDEPETHLDSNLIATYLVDLIKKRKYERQIIFATHNANFVINGDAEKIFVLEDRVCEGTIVHETTIENMKYRDKLLALEGGKEAFRQRGLKLSIS